MAKKLSLFIEDTSLCLLVCDNERIVKWVNRPLEGGLVANGVVINEEKLAEVIRQELVFHKIKQKMTILGLTGLNSLYRIINLPQMPESLLVDAIRHEAERVMPVSISDVYLSYQIIPGGKNDEKRIFLAAYPKITADSLLHTLKRAGLEPYLVDLGPLALARTVSGPRAVAVNARGATLDIVIMVDKVPRVLRSLELPTEVTALTEKLAATAEEIERTIAFYNQSQEENSLNEKDPVLVTGDLVKVREHWDLLATRLGHPIFPITSPMLEPEGFDAALFMVNIGLILKESPREKSPEASLLINFNALPAAYHHRQISPLNIIVPVVLVLAAAILTVLILLTSGVRNQVAVLNAEQANIQKQIGAVQSDVNTLRPKVKQLQEQANTLEVQNTVLSNKLTSLKTSRINKDELTSQIISLIPGNLEVTGLEYQLDTVTLEGNSPRLDNIYEYARAIRRTNRLEVILTNVEWNQTEDAGVYNYSIKLKER